MVLAALGVLHLEPLHRDQAIVPQPAVHDTAAACVLAGLVSGDVGLFYGDIGLFSGVIGFVSGDIELFDGDIGLFYGEYRARLRT